MHEPQTNIAAATEAGSADPATRAAAILAEHRASIDRLDAVLVFTLAERFKHTQGVGRLKAEHALPPSDPATVRQTTSDTSGCMIDENVQIAVAPR